jgi:aspartyl-tRNA(Asn)/glutamyl-tRNA(Gln) amidotransferase subunit A
VKGLRIGVVRHFFEVDSPVTAETQAGIETSLDILRAEGATIENVTLSPLRAYSAVNRIIMNCEAAAIHEKFLATRPADYTERLRHRLILASMLGSSDYLQAQRRRRELCAEFAAAMVRHDVLLTAISAGEAPPVSGIGRWDGLLGLNFAAPWNLTGYPAITVCTGFGPTGLPLALQIGGRPFDEATVLRVAHLLERTTGWHTRRPALAG